MKKLIDASRALLESLDDPDFNIMISSDAEALRRALKEVESESYVFPLPSDTETTEWFEQNIEQGCPASVAIFKFRLWLRERQFTSVLFAEPPFDEFANIFCKLVFKNESMPAELERSLTEIIKQSLEAGRKYERRNPVDPTPYAPTLNNKNHE